MTNAAQDVMYTVKLESGETYGPAPLATIVQWVHEGRVPHTALLLGEGGQPPIPVIREPTLAPLFQRRNSSNEDDALATIVPYRNPPALAGYYVSIASLLPLVGAVAGPTAIILGIFGLKKRKADPQCKGMAHAWIAISLGLIGTLISATCLSAMILPNLFP